MTVHRAALREGVDVRRPVAVPSGAGDVADADVVAEDEDDVGLPARGGGEGGREHAEEGEQAELHGKGPRVEPADGFIRR